MSKPRSAGARKHAVPTNGTLRLLTGLLLVLPRPIAPATIVVEGDCTLPDAVTAANTDAPAGGCPAGSGADEILLTGGIALTRVHNEACGVNGLPVIATDITVRGRGFPIERDAAAEPFRIFRVARSGILTLEDTSVRGGAATTDVSCDGGGGIHSGGSLTLVNTTVSGNFAEGDGGGIYTSSEAILIETTVSDNYAGLDGGGLFSRGGILSLMRSAVLENAGDGIHNTGTSFATLTDSTVSGNLGAGIFNYGSALSVVNSTISGNVGGIGTYYGDRHVPTVVVNSTISGNGGSGILVWETYLSLENSTVSGDGTPSSVGLWVRDYGDQATVTASLIGNSAGGACAGFDLPIDGGGNFADDATCGEGFGVLTGLDPELAGNGGPTLTHALLPGSSAIDAAGECGLPIDQRGFPRDTACDSGSFEFAAAAPVGGSVTGMEAREKAVSCGNGTSGRRISFALEDFSFWDCEAAGLTVEPGDRIRMTVRGTALTPEAAPVGGSVSGMALRRVQCRNETTGQEVDLSTPGATSWDCAEAGLAVAAGDRILQTLAGTAD